MKKILCYGDSNTFGLEAETLKRYSEQERWSGILKNILKNNYEVIEEGLCDRNGFVKNIKGYEYCALEHLPVCLKKYTDIHLIIIALGTNDLQFTYNFDEIILKNGLYKLIEIIKKLKKEIRIIIVPPVKLDKYVTLGFFNYQFNDISVARSDETFYLYQKIAKQTDCGYFDFNQIVRPSNKDGLHYETTTHGIIAENFAKYIITAKN